MFSTRKAKMISAVYDRCEVHAMSYGPLQVYHIFESGPRKIVYRHRKDLAAFTALREEKYLKYHLSINCTTN